MDFLKIGKYASSIIAVGVLLSGAWWLTGELKIRPVLSRELDPIQEQLAAVTKDTLYLQWIRLDAQARAGTISPSDRILYCQISRQLNLQGHGCA